MDGHCGNAVSPARVPKDKAAILASWYQLVLLYANLFLKSRFSRMCLRFQVNSLYFVVSTSSTGHRVVKWPSWASTLRTRRAAFKSQNANDPSRPPVSFFLRCRWKAVSSFRDNKSTFLWSTHYLKLYSKQARLHSLGAGLLIWVPAK